MERELTAPVDIAQPDGRLNRDAMGWARHPLQRCNLAPTLARVARWSYWCVTSRGGALTLLVAEVGWFGVALVSFLDFAAPRPVERVYVRPGGLPVPAAPDGDFEVDARRLRLALRTRDGEMRVTGAARTLLGRRIGIDLTVLRSKSHETLNVLVPWDDTRFHFTSKQQALPARGVVTVDGREHRFGDDNQGFACLDFGCGRWPSQIAWRWAFASATTRGGRTIGLNLGALWTDGTGVTENGVVIDGRVHKIAEAVDFEHDARAPLGPWRIRSRRVDLRFDPLRERAVRIPLLVVSAEVHQLVGRFSGVVVDDGGEAVRLDDVLGVAERVKGRW